MQLSRPIKHSIEIDGYETSISLENVFWDELQTIAKQQHVTMQDLVSAINQQCGSRCCLSSALRHFVLGAHMDKAGV